MLKDLLALRGLWASACEEVEPAHAPACEQRQVGQCASTMLRFALAHHIRAVRCVWAIASVRCVR